MLMNKEKDACSVLFPLVSQPIQVQGHTQQVSAGRFHRGLVVDHLCLGYVKILRVWSWFWVYTSTWTRAPAPWPQPNPWGPKRFARRHLQYISPPFLVRVVDSRLFPHLAHRKQFLCQSFPAPGILQHPGNPHIWNTPQLLCVSEQI